MRAKDKCTRCGKKFFIEHENSVVIDEDNSLVSVMNSSVAIGYKILECIFCSKMHIGRQYDKGTMEEIIPIEEFNTSDGVKFKERSNVRGGVDVSDQTIGKMIK